MKKTLLATATVALMAFSLPALAQNAASTAERPQRMQRADTNGDGNISRDEFVSRRLERLRTIDANHDGSVTREEMQAAAQARRAERNAARFARLDADNNGSISQAEFAAPRMAGQRGEALRAGGNRMHGPRARHAGNRMRRGDGQPVTIAQVETRLNATFARLDTDANGLLTAAEARAGRDAMRARGEARRGEGRHRMRGQRGAGAEHQSPQAPGSE
jgi:hypothetical protein